MVIARRHAEHHRNSRIGWLRAAVLGAALPVIVVAMASAGQLLPWTAVASSLFLAGLGAVSARIGGAPVWSGTWRVAFWGAVAMAVTAGAGALTGTIA